MEKYFSGSAFVSFNTEKEKEDILLKYHKPDEKLIFQGN